MYELPCREDECVGDERVEGVGEHFSVAGGAIDAGCVGYFGNAEFDGDDVCAGVRGGAGTGQL